MEFEELRVEIPVDDGEKEDNEFPFMLEKRYENKSGCFVTGFDVTSKEAETRRNRRAKRFGLQLAKKEDEKDDIQSEQEASTGSSSLSAEELPIINDGEVRPDALYVHGVDDLSTKDVFAYFNDFVPGSIEWIDDASCNVVWEDDFTASRVLMAVGKEIITQDPDEEESSTEKIKWRIGPPHPNSKRLLLRLATKKDKKQPGAAKRSMYYLVNGNPGSNNYKGARKGIVSTSRKRKIVQERERAKHLYSGEPEVMFLDKIEADKDERMDIDEPPLKVVVTNDGPIEKKDPLNLRMRMYADTVEEDESESDEDEDRREKRDRWKGKKEKTEISHKPEEKKAPSLDLRLKLQSRHRHGFDYKNRPSLSIEIKEEPTS